MKKTTFNSIPTTEQINKDIERIKNQIPSYKTKDVLISILNLIDLTSLNTSDTVDKIRNMTLKINDFNKTFPNFKNVAAICVYPIFVQLVKETLLVKNVKIAAVGASFPASQTFLSIKAAECELIIHKGADEVDIVLSVGSFLEKNYLKVAQEIEIIKNTIKDAHLKVILETGELQNTDNIFKASIISMESGADFIKTSTGKSPVSATPEAVYTMCCAIKEFFEKTGKRIGIKPSGGMTYSEDAIMFYLIVQKVLGNEWLNNEFFRLGASRLANNILTDLSAIEGKNEQIKYF